MLCPQIHVRLVPEGDITVSLTGVYLSQSVTLQPERCSTSTSDRYQRSDLCRFRGAAVRVGILNNAISHATVSAIVGGSGRTDSCVRERKTKTLVLAPLRFLLVIREWLGLRDLVQDAGTFPFCRAVI